MIDQYEITIPPQRRGFHLITHLITRDIGSLPEKGTMHLFIKHTSAGITINENTDPTIREDFESSFNNLVKENEPFYKHTFEGSDDMPAHIKSSIVGSSVSLPIKNGRLDLGTWQGIYLCEFRNRGWSRNLTVTVYS